MTLLDWIGRLPDQWEARPLRSVADYIVSNVDKLASEDEIPVHLCNYTDVYHNEFITLGLEFMSATASEHEIEKFGLSKGDVIITKDSESWEDIGVPALVRETADDLVCGYHLALLRPHKTVMDSAFFFRCLQAKPIRLQLELSARGVTRFGLSKSEIGAMTLPVPSLPQQRVIADYLDREMARLDMLVTAKERMLELLVERRKVLITAAVTRGVDSAEPTKPPELGALDEEKSLYKSAANRRGGHTFIAGNDGVTVQNALPYPTMRLKHIVSLRQSRVNGNGSRYVGLEHIEPWTGKLFDSLSSASMEDTAQSNAFSPGDVLFGKLRPYLAKVWVTEFAGRSTTECLVMKPVDVESRFLGYACLSRDFIDAVDASTFGSKMPRAEWGFIGNMRVPVPSLPQQRAIADYLDRETARLDMLKVKIQSTIALLKERRAALIAALVTGQIDVESAA